MSAVCVDEDGKPVRGRSESPFCACRRRLEVVATLLSHLMVVNEEYACRPLRLTLAYALDGRSQPRGRADDDRLGSTELLVAHQILAKFSEERGSVDSQSVRRVLLAAAVSLQRRQARLCEIAFEGMALAA